MFRWPIHVFLLTTSWYRACDRALSSDELDGVALLGSVPSGVELEATGASFEPVDLFEGDHTAWSWVAVGAVLLTGAVLCASGFIMREIVGPYALVAMASGALALLVGNKLAIDRGLALSSAHMHAGRLSVSSPLGRVEFVRGRDALCVYFFEPTALNVNGCVVMIAGRNPVARRVLITNRRQALAALGAWHAATLH